MREARAMAAWAAWVTVKASFLEAVTMLPVEALVKVRVAMRLRPGIEVVLVAARRRVGMALTQVFREASQRACCSGVAVGIWAILRIGGGGFWLRLQRQPVRTNVC